MKKIIKCLSISLGIIAALCIIDCKPANAALVRLSPQHFYSWAQQGNKTNLEKYKRYINIADRNQNTALCLAQQAKDRKAYSLLLDYNASPNVPCHDNDDKVCAVIIGEKLKVSPAGLLVLGAGALAAGAYFAFDDDDDGDKCNIADYPLDNCPENGVCSQCKGKKRLDGCENNHRPNANNTACICDTANGNYDDVNTCKVANPGYECKEEFGCYIKDKDNVTLCPAGYIAGLTDCSGKVHPEGWEYTENGMSGEQKCGKCTEKEPGGFIPDPENPTPDYPSCNTKCAEKQTGVNVIAEIIGYYGDTPCYSCTYTCEENTFGSETDCTNGGHVCLSSTMGGNTCWYRTGEAVPCNAGFEAGRTDCSDKDHPEGWKHTPDTDIPFSGDQMCGKCDEIFTPLDPVFPSCNTDCPTAETGMKVTPIHNGWFGDQECFACTYACADDAYDTEPACKDGGYECDSTTQGGKTCWYRTGDTTDCRTGYTAGLKNCNDKDHPEAWDYKTDDVIPMSGGKVCGICTAKQESCPANTSADACPASKFLASSTVDSYAGDTACYTCTYTCDTASGYAETCPAGRDCGTLETTPDGKDCYNVTNPSCPTDASFTSKSECEKDGYNCSENVSGSGCWKRDSDKTCSADEITSDQNCAAVTGFTSTKNPTGNWAGGEQCYSCSYACATGYADTCPAGKDCGTPVTAPDGKTCYNVTDLNCPTDAPFTSKSACETDGYVCSENVAGSGCWKQDSEAQCPAGYSTTIESADDCETTGSKGYTLVSNGKSGGKDCNKCDNKGCPGHSLVNTQHLCPSAGSGENFLFELREDTYDGENQCGLCTYTCIYADKTACLADNIGYDCKQQTFDHGTLASSNTCWVKGDDLSCPANTSLTCEAAKTGFELTQTGSGDFAGATECQVCTYNCASGYFETPEACQVEGDKTGMSCESTTQGGKTCYFVSSSAATDCPTGYTIVAQDVSQCGTTGADGYTLDDSGKLSNGKKCTKCVENETCPANYSTSITSSCPVIDGLTGTVVQGDTYLGEIRCNSCSYVCDEKTAFEDRTDCLKGGWNCYAEIKTTISGTKTCQYRRGETPCNGVFNTDDSSREKCGEHLSGWNWTQDTVTPESGGKVCGYCQEISCPANTSTDITDIGNCASASGIKSDVVRGTVFSGDDRCNSCSYTCNESSKFTDRTACENSKGGGWSCSLETTNIDGRSVDCYVVTKEAGCSTGYSTDIETAADCFEQGSNGWTVVPEGKTSGGKDCNKCVEIPCDGDSQTKYADTAQCPNTFATLKVTGHSEANYHGDTQCYTCTYSCANGDDGKEAYSSRSACELGGYSCEETSEKGITCYAREGITVCREAEGYSTKYPNQASCSKTGNTSGWTWTSDTVVPSSGGNVCGKCTEKTPSNYIPDPAGSEPEFPNCLTKCSDTLPGIQAMKTSIGFYGDHECFACNYNCATGSFADKATCEKEGYVCNSSQQGNSGTCWYKTSTPKDCDTESGYKAGLTNCNDKAHPTAWTWSQDATTPLSGTAVCGKCSPIQESCPANTTANSCTASKFLAASNIDSYAGDTPCYTCTYTCDSASGYADTCPAGKDCGTPETTPDSKTCYNVTNPGCPTDAPYTTEAECEEDGYVCSENVSGSGCWKRDSEAECPSGYSADIETADDCKTTGSKGYTLIPNGKSGGKDCNRCIAKDKCPSPLVTLEPYCPASQADEILNALEKDPDHFQGEKQCGRCTYTCKYADEAACLAGNTGYKCKQVTYDHGAFGTNTCWVKGDTLGCPDGEIISAQTCPSITGFTSLKTPTDHFAGGNRCYKCVYSCDTANGYEESCTVAGKECPSIVVDDKTCYNTNAATCPEGYDSYPLAGCESSGYKCEESAPGSGCTRRTDEAIECPVVDGVQSRTSCGASPESEDGWYATPTGQYSGGTECKKCEAKECYAPYNRTDPDACGTVYGLVLNVDSENFTYAGDERCYMCDWKCDDSKGVNYYSDKTSCEAGEYNCNKQKVVTPLGGASFLECYVRSSSCPSGYTAGLEDCSEKPYNGAGYGHESNGKTSSGETCGKCTAKMPEEGCVTSATSCGNSEANRFFTFDITPNGKYYGDTVCNECVPTCNEDNRYYETYSLCKQYNEGLECTSVEVFAGANHPCNVPSSCLYATQKDCEEATNHVCAALDKKTIHGDTCYWETKDLLPCTEGYVRGKDVNDCGNGTVGELGWDYEPDPNNSTCGKCTKKNVGCTTNTEEGCNASAFPQFTFSLTLTGEYQGDDACGVCTPHCNTENGYYEDQTTCESGESGITYHCDMTKDAHTCYKRGVTRGCGNGAVSSVSQCTGVNSGETVQLKDMVGTYDENDKPCQTCSFTCLYADKGACETANTGYSCKQTTYNHNLYGSNTCWVKGELICPAGYTQGLDESQIATCGTQGSNGWKILSITTEDGVQCGKCDKKPCENGSSTSYTTAGACPLKDGLKATGVSGTNYNGQDKCYSCNYTCQYSTQASCNLATSSVCRSRTYNGQTCYIYGITCQYTSYQECYDSSSRPSGATCVEDNGCWYHREYTSCYSTRTECEANDRTLCILDGSEWCPTGMVRHCDKNYNEYETEAAATTACSTSGYSYDTTKHCYYCKQTPTICKTEIECEADCSSGTCAHNISTGCYTCLTDTICSSSEGKYDSMKACENANSGYKCVAEGSCFVKGLAKPCTIGSTEYTTAGACPNAPDGTRTVKPVNVTPTGDISGNLQCYQCNYICNIDAGSYADKSTCDTETGTNCVSATQMGRTCYKAGSCLTQAVCEVAHSSETGKCIADKNGCYHFVADGSESGISQAACDAKCDEVCVEDKDSNGDYYCSTTEKRCNPALGQYNKTELAVQHCDSSFNYDPALNCYVCANIDSSCLGNTYNGSSVSTCNRNCSGGTCQQISGTSCWQCSTDNTPLTCSASANEYYTEEDCQNAYKEYKCEKSVAGCYVPTTKKTLVCLNSIGQYATEDECTGKCSGTCSGELGSCWKCTLEGCDSNAGLYNSSDDCYAATSSICSLDSVSGCYKAGQEIKLCRYTSSAKCDLACGNGVCEADLSTENCWNCVISDYPDSNCGGQCKSGYTCTKMLSVEGSESTSYYCAKDSTTCTNPGTDEFSSSTACENVCDGSCNKSLTTGCFTCSHALAIPSGCYADCNSCKANDLTGSSCIEQNVSSNGTILQYCCSLSYADYNDNPMVMTSTGSEDIVGMESSEDITNGSDDDSLSLMSTTAVPTNNGNITIIHNSTGNAYGMRGLADNTLINEATGNITIHNNTTGNAYGMYTSLGGTAINRGNITITGTTGTAYGIYGEGQNNIENSGTIDVSGKDAYGIYVKDGKGSTVLNTISGIININATGEAHGIYIDENSRDAVVKNEGKIVINNVEKPGETGITLNGATLENASEISFSGDADLNSMGGKIVLAKGGSFEAMALSGDVDVGTSTVMGGNKDTYVSESAFKAEDISGLNVKSESALFDTKVEKNADGDGYNVTQERKDFAEFTPNASIANYLEANYADGELEEAFDEIKSQTSEKATAESFAKKLGYDVMPNFADENFTIMKSLTRNIADNVLKPTDEVNRVVAGYDNFSWETDTKGTLSGSDLSANTMYTFGDKRLDNKNRLGLGLSFTQLSTSYDMGGSRDLNIVSIFVPYVHKFTEKLRLATVASVGYGYGDYDRGSYESDINDIFYSLSNELRYTADLNGFAELEPALMLNAIGYTEEGFDEGEGKDALETRRTHNLSVEAGVGLYLKKDIKTEKYGKLGFKIGGAYYHEFGSPYDDISARFKNQGNGWYRMNDYAGVYNRDRAIIEAMVDYEYKRLSLYLKYNRLIQKNNPQLFDLGVKYNF